MMNATLRRTILAAVLMMLMVATAWAGMPHKGDNGIIFTYLDPEAKAVFVAGDFNGWNAGGISLLMKEDGTWIVSIPLDAGTYEYKYIVDEVWVEDPDNPEKKVDPFGGSNSVLVVLDDGSVGGAAPVASPAAAAAAKPTGKITVGAPRAVDGGIEFTYAGSGAGSVCLAGTFNGWNATANPLSKDDKGNWIIVHPLDAGSHEYKFVVDGNWLADPENPDTASDPYGGVNSLVTVDDKGQLTAAAAVGDDSDGGLQNNTSLNAKLHLDGRYLTRMETAKNINDDPRYRMQRPKQSVDLNFKAQVSDLAETFMRIRMDSDENLIQNNVAGFLDEANLVIHPENFMLKAYLNQETYTQEDLIKAIGNQDHPGTIGHDHLNYGKGTAGALFEADPFGIHTRAFFANVHNAEYYGDPDLFDNLGSDVIGLRFSRKIGNFEIGVPGFMNRDLVWLDFNELTAQPTTGIPVLDDHRAQTGDASTWYETDNYVFQGGLDARFHFTDALQVGAQAMVGNETQRFVTGNESGENNTNGSLDLPYLERDFNSLRFQLDLTPGENLTVMAQHTISDYSGAAPDQRRIDFVYLSQEEANNNIYFEIDGSPAEVNEGFSELELDYHKNDLSLGLWAWHRSLSYDYQNAGATVPGDTTRTSRDQGITYLSGLAGFGRMDAGLGHAELEFGLSWNDPDTDGSTQESQELIFRYEREFARNTSAMADVRYITYQLEEAEGTSKPSYWAPFVGVRHTPIRNLELVLGYGVDPVNFSIEYQGRQMGRWWYRQNYLFDNPDASLQDAEDYLASARVITLRAQFIF